MNIELKCLRDVLTHCGHYTRGNKRAIRLFLGWHYHLLWIAVRTRGPRTSTTTFLINLQKQAQTEKLLILSRNYRLHMAHHPPCKPQIARQSMTLYTIWRSCTTSRNSNLFLIFVASSVDLIRSLLVLPTLCVIRTITVRVSHKPLPVLQTKRELRWKSYKIDWCPHLSYLCLASNTAILSMPMLGKKTLVQSHFESSCTDRWDQSNIGQDLLHKPNVITIRPSRNASTMYGLSCSYVLTSKEVDLSPVPITPSFHGFRLIRWHSETHMMTFRTIQIRILRRYPIWNETPGS